MNNNELEKQDYQTIQEIISYSFKDLKLLEKALLLFSPHYNKAQKEEFKRLVFFGESIISFIVSQRAYHKLAHLKEGALMRLRTKLTKEEIVKEYFFNLGLHEKIPLIRHFFSDCKDAEKNYPAANSLKALIAALHMDGELTTALTFFNRYCLPAAKPFLQDKHHFNWRRKLQEWCDKYKKMSPQYLVLEEIGPEHARTYKMGLFLEDELLAKSEAPTKKKAANLAASKALNKVKLWEADFESQSNNEIREGSKPA